MFRKAKLILTRFVGIVFIILAVALDGYCQSGKPRVDINKVYESEVKRLLMPGNDLSTQTHVLAAFLVHPELDPDYSVCLKDSASQFFLELQLLNKNINQELMSRFMQKLSLILPLNTSVYKVVVSKGFKNKILEAFYCVTPDKENHDYVQYDGISYEFTRVKNGKIEKIPFSYGVIAESYEARLATVLIQLFSDLKNNSFRESEYIKKLGLN